MKNRKMLMALLFAFLVCVVFTTTSSADDIKLDPGDIPVEMDPTMRCRCKKNGCYGGNALSFRPACAKGNGPIQCNEYNGNCA